jgi:glycosyltransferase involved in cell wall biosynthesis
MELTILMPCLNEAETLAICVRKAKHYLEESGIEGEVLIADNGSTDGSQAIAQEEKARVVQVTERGYGAALLGGIEAARGRYIIMGDADDSYDFSRLEAFVNQLRAGADLVMGNRFQGGISAGAMPWLHKYIGNPILSLLGRMFFKIKIGDFHCGLRGFNTTRIRDLNLRTTGMEFASELVVKSAMAKYRIDEVPTTLRQDGRSRSPHLRTWPDGWRHLTFLLLHTPRWLFLYPGLFILLFGIIGIVALFYSSVSIAGITLGLHTFLSSCFAVLVGAQAVSFGIIARRFAANSGIMPKSTRYSKFLEALTLERMLIFAVLLIAVGAGLFLWCLLQWAKTGFGPLEYSSILRPLILSTTAITLGLQFIFSALLSAIMEIRMK